LLGFAKKHGNKGEVRGKKRPREWEATHLRLLSKGEGKGGKKNDSGHQGGVQEDRHGTGKGKTGIPWGVRPEIRQKGGTNKENEGMCRFSRREPYPRDFAIDMSGYSRCTGARSEGVAKKEKDRKMAKNRGKKKSQTSRKRSPAGVVVIS